MKNECGFKGEDAFYSCLREEKKPAGLKWGMQQSPLIMGGAAAIITFKPATNSVTGEVYCDLACQMCGKPLQQHRGKPHWPKKGKYGIFITAYDLVWTQACDDQSIIQVYWQSTKETLR